ncbi:MAG: sulfatase-like hydrolase/transferase [Bacteroidota bacterium]
MKVSYLLLLSLLGLVCQPLANEEQVAKPNIILIYVDDMGLGDASFTSGKIRPPPHIDRMAREGKVFTQYYTNSPVCSPSRVAVTTGMYPLRWQINTFLSGKKHNDLCQQLGYLDAKAPSLARALKASGYATAHFGKWHMGGGRKINAPSIKEYGFDEYVSTWESPDPDPLLTSSNWIWAPTDSIKRWERTAYFVDKTLDFFKRKEGPCYINLWPDDVHTPWVPTEESQDHSREQKFSLPNLEPVITAFDYDVGRLLAGIEALGEAENTLIIFTSDNGPAPSFGYKRTIGLRGTKNSLYEGGINMPFIAYWPGVIQAGQRDEQSVISAVDLFPSLCQIGGAALPEGWRLDGEDMSAALRNASIFRRERDLHWEYGRFNPKTSTPKDSLDRSLPIAIRHGEWKFYSDLEGKKVELYHLPSDPNERQDQASAQVALVSKLQKEALEWFANNDKSEVQ